MILVYLCRCITAASHCGEGLILIVRSWLVIDQKQKQKEKKEKKEKKKRKEEHYPRRKRPIHHCHLVSKPLLTEKTSIKDTGSTINKDNIK